MERSSKPLTDLGGAGPIDLGQDGICQVFHRRQAERIRARLEQDGFTQQVRQVRCSEIGVGDQDQAFPTFDQRTEHFRIGDGAGQDDHIRAGGFPDELNRAVQAQRSPECAFGAIVKNQQGIVCGNRGGE